MLLSNYLKIATPVQEAIFDKQPVVALESTIISHGMPWPANIETALLLEDTIRKEGAVPATIAIIDGIIQVGLTKDLIAKIAKSTDILKASRRDLATVIAKRLSAATTVSATMICAALAKIEFFATGGIGGVHRNASSTFDISADLYELSNTPVLVVAAGAKAILDIKLTLEKLETLGVPVIGYKTSIFPAFYYSDSGFNTPHKADSPAEVAKVFAASKQLGLQNGILVANPIPKDSALDKLTIEKIIEQALQEADHASIDGSKITPFLLQKLEALSSGSSLKANIALVENNAKVCAQIAVEHSKL